MTRNKWLGLFFIGALIYSLVSIFQQAPGYMDADYYAATGAQLAAGKGFSEPFIWNYLNHPTSIPTPSHLYWMPLASILAAIGSKFSFSGIFTGMKIPFVLMAAVLVPLSTAAGSGFIREKRFAWLSGAAAVFAGLYWIYLTLPETFTIYMLAGAGLIAMIGGASLLRVASWKGLGLAIFAGILTGIMHLTRADGVLWLAGSMIWVFGSLLYSRKNLKNRSVFRIVMILAAILCGYLLVMGFWYIRNMNLFGVLMPPGNSRALWLTNYNQTFDYPADQITFANWITSDWGAILASRWQALKLNIANLVVVQGGIAFLPLILIGIWRFRTDQRIRFMLFMGLLTFLVMTLVFPFAGARGGYLHSGAAFQLYLWALIPAGLESVLEWGRRKRGWNIRQGFKVFSIGLVVIAMLLSGFFFSTRVLGSDSTGLNWGSSERAYQWVNTELLDMGISKTEIGAVNNPPGYFWATGRSSIVIPNGDLSHLLAAARNFNATYLILEKSQANLENIYLNPGNQDGLNYLGIVGDIQVYRISGNE